MALETDMSRMSHDELIANIISLKEELDVVRRSEQELLNSIQHLLKEIETEKNDRLNPEQYSDISKELASAVNNALDAISKQEGEKTAFYLNILDSLPTPLSVTNMDENWTFINKKTEEFLNVKRNDVIGMHCSNWGADVCNTEQCGIKALRRGESEVSFVGEDRKYKAFLAYLQTPDGKKIGHIETMVDTTDVFIAAKVESYQKRAVQALSASIDEIAHGNAVFPFYLPPPDDDTLHIYNYYVETFENIEKISESISGVISEIQALIKAVREGRLDYHANGNEYKGNFKLLIEQINEMQDAISEPVRDAIRVCGCYATGDFTARTNPDHVTEGEWEVWRTSLDKIGINVSHQLQTIAKQMDELSLLTENTSEEMKVGMKGTEQMLTMANQISESSSEGSKNIAQVVKLMEDLSLSVGETATRSQHVSNNASQANEYAVVGMEQTQKSGLVMEGITDSTRVLEIMIKDINVQMAEIGKIVQLISDISNQTNLLALNAAIEAARAGDAGRGFAVVASEVKALAQDSRRSAENITDMISSLQEKAKKADQATNQASGVVQQGKVAVDENLSMLEKIVTSVGDINQNSLEVASFAEEQTAAVQEATLSIAQVADQIQHSADYVEQISIVTQETGTAIIRIGDVFDEINLIAKEISGRITQFQLTDDEIP